MATESKEPITLRKYMNILMVNGVSATEIQELCKKLKDGENDVEFNGEKLKVKK